MKKEKSNTRCATSFGIKFTENDFYSHLLSGVNKIKHLGTIKVFVNCLRSLSGKFIPKFNKIVLTIFIITLNVTADLHAEELHIGTATADITPALPVAVCGQFHLRIAETAETPLTANIIALESRDGNHSLDVAIMVSCDLVFTK